MTLSTPGTVRMSGRCLFRPGMRNLEGAGRYGDQHLAEEGGAQRSKRRTMESDDAAEIRVAECGENSAL